MPIPVTAEQGHIEPCIDERTDQRKPVGVATPDEQHIARDARWIRIGPWPVYIGIIAEWQVMDGADTAAEEITDICTPRRKNDVIRGNRGEEPRRAQSRIPGIIGGIIDHPDPATAQDLDMRAIQWCVARCEHDTGSRSCTHIKNVRTELAEPGRPFAAQVPIKASSESAACLGAAGIDHLVLDAQLPCSGSEIGSHMPSLGEAYDQ